MSPITSVSQMPHLVKGVLSLRGKITPTIDQCLGFNIPEIERRDRTSIIIAEIVTGPGRTWMGILVNIVLEVFNIKSKDIGEVPTFRTGLATGCIIRRADVERWMRTLLDIGCRLNPDL